MERLYSTLKFEAARKSMKKSIDELTEQILKTDNKIPDLYFVCGTNDFEWRISQLGVLSKTEKKEIIVRDYSSIKKPLVSFGNLGIGIDRIRVPRGILVDESNSRIFVADHNNLIRVWSMDGNYLSATTHPPPSNGPRTAPSLFSGIDLDDQDAEGLFDSPASWDLFVTPPPETTLTSAPAAKPKPTKTKTQPTLFDPIDIDTDEGGLFDQTSPVKKTLPPARQDILDLPPQPTPPATLPHKLPP